MEIHISEREAGVRLLRIERPPANAINGELLQTIYRTIADCEGDALVRAVVVTGTGRFFSAGLDVKELARQGAGDLGQLGGGRDGIYRLWRLPKPTIAMVNGHAIAGGAVLMLACDFRIAARGSYKIGLTETALGLPLPNGAFQIAKLGLPDASHRRVLLEADTFDPDGALTVGLLDEVVEADRLEARCLALASKLGAHPTGAYGYNKYALQAEANDLIHHPPEIGGEGFMAALASPETQRALFGREKK